MKKRASQQNCPKNKKVDKILRQIAKENGVTVEEIRSSINDAIREAIETAKREGNQRVLNLWKQVPCIGEVPTAEEAIPWLAENAARIAESRYLS